MDDNDDGTTDAIVERQCKQLWWITRRRLRVDWLPELGDVRLPSQSIFFI